MPGHYQTAPGELEAVRRFINTWSIPNDTRRPTDALPDLARAPGIWSSEFPRRPRSRIDTLERMQRLRADLRSACEGGASGDEALNNWFNSSALSVKVRWLDGTPKLAVESSEMSFIGYIVAIVANAIATGEWARLKTCPDCQWAFYDHTRNGKKRWCGMTKGGPEGRACGTIAKVTAYRARKAMKTGVA